MDLTSGEVELHVLGCRLTYWGQIITNAEARFSIALRPQKPQCSLGRTAQDGHLDFHTALTTLDGCVYGPGDRCM